MEISCAMECARGAVRMNNQALEACKLHTSELRKAMEAENEDVSRDVVMQIWNKSNIIKTLVLPGRSSNRNYLKELYKWEATMTNFLCCIG